MFKLGLKKKGKNMIETITEILNAAPVWLVAITGVISAASAVTALTPTKTDDKIINAILKVLNVLSLNVGKNKNADDS